MLDTVSEEMCRLGYYFPPFVFCQTMYKTTQERPLCSITLLNDSDLVFEGEWRDNSVWILNKDQIEKLFASGAFGKGILSRTKPTFVENNTNSNDAKFHRRKKAKTDQLGKTPISLPESFVEPLQLNIYDAFFILYCFENKLLIKRGDQSITTAADLWPLCCRSDAQFITHYAAYHYYRSRGWMVKSGIKYGVDFLIYEDSPAVVHAEFGVRVLAEHDVKSDTSNTSDSTRADDTCQSDTTAPPATWMLLNNLNRVSETVKKGLLLCYVIWPANMSPLALDASDEQYAQVLSNLSQFTVREVKFGRWKPSKTRN